MAERTRVTSGVGALDKLLGGLYIGDNVVWHDDAGSLVSPFCLNFIQSSQSQGKPLIYVSFDRSPKNLMDTLGPLSENPMLSILDCFTFGKGARSPIFLKFYEGEGRNACRVIPVKEPARRDKVVDALYGIHGTMTGDVRFVFETLTGMQDLWGGEEEIIDFYSHSCPRLYGLNTIAYWIMEKRAHSPRLRARINRIAQVAIDLAVKRGKTYVTVLKAEKRSPDTLNRPYHYWCKDLNIVFDSESRTASRIALGTRLKELRSKRGISQTELAKLVGVTPSTISQVESDFIYPSLPALVKMAEVLSVEVSSFFRDPADETKRVIFPGPEGTEVKFQDLPEGSIQGKLLTPIDFDPRAEPYLIEIPAKKTLPSHFFVHKGEELGYVLSGKLQLKIQRALRTARAGDVVYLTTDMPSQWKNPGPGPARILWIKIK